MRMKQMVEVKNAWKNDGNLMNGRSAKKKMHMKIMGVERTEDLTKKKKMSLRWMVNVKNAYKNDGCWTNGRFDWQKKDGCKTNDRSEKCIWK